MSSKILVNLLVTGTLTTKEARTNGYSKAEVTKAWATIYDRNKRATFHAMKNESLCRVSTIKDLTDGIVKWITKKSKV